MKNKKNNVIICAILFLFVAFSFCDTAMAREFEVEPNPKSSYRYTGEGVGTLCGNELKGIIGLVGYVILGIKIAAPIILIVVGMMDLAKASTAKDDNAIKTAQTALIKKAVSAVAVFLVATIVVLVMKLVGSDEWKTCAAECLNTPGPCVKNLSNPF